MLYLSKNFKILFFILTSSLFYNCSSDDDNMGKEQMFEKVQLLDYLVFENIPYSVIYNGDYLIQSVRILDTNYTFSYENGKVSKIIKLQNDNQTVYQFRYDQNEIINKFFINDDYFPIGYDPATSTYIFEDGLLNGSIRYYKTNEQGDLMDFRKENQDGTQNKWGYEFDTTKKGALFNTNSITLYLFMINENSLDILLPFSKYPVSLAYTGSFNFECTNEYDENLFITNLICFGQEVSFHYKEVEIPID